MSGLKQHSKYGTKKRSLSTPYKTKIRLQHLVFKITHYSQKHISMRLCSPTGANISEIRRTILTVQSYFIDKSRQSPVLLHNLRI